MSKLCVEYGMVVAKEVIPAKDEYIFKGEKIPARDESYKIVSISGSDCDEVNGYESLTMVNHYIEKGLFESLKFGDQVKVRYDYCGDDKAKKSQGISLIKQ